MNKIIGLVICHKNLAEELIHTAEAIIGHRDNLFSFTNDRYDTKALVENVEAFLKQQDNPDHGVIMVDLRGGNCWTVGKLISRKYPQFHLLTGVNLPMIFSFLTKKDSFSLRELVDVMESDAHRGIVLE